MPSLFAGTTDFFFPTDVPVTAGVVYYFEPVVQSGGSWNLVTADFSYPGGSAFYEGLPLPGSDVWFREGIVVPEPSSALLVVVGVGAFLFVRRSRQRR